ncbi:hypothetical protein EDB87DRAFT_730456 [Lactarius vividus]|nr:hypothetical protein EDB87DRAFT_730456 [Lactarius vividus]
MKSKRLLTSLHLDTHFSRTPRYCASNHPTSCNLFCFHLFIYPSLQLHSPVCLISHTRFRTLSLFLYTMLLIGPPLDPALSAVHYFFFFALCYHRRSLFHFTSPTFAPTLCTSTSIRSFVYIQTVPRRRFLTGANQTLYNMLSSTSAVPCPLLASQVPSCRAHTP